MSTGTVIYAYGFVRAGFDASRAPAGIDDARVEVIGDDANGFRALGSRLPADAYDAAAIERATADLAWLTPRAQAHDMVLTWAQEHGGVLPLPMFTLWASDASLVATLAQRQPEIARAAKRVADADEYGLRVHRRDAQLLESVTRLDDDLRALATQVDGASPGQRYLLQKKLDEQKKTAVKRVGQSLARDAYERLRAISRESVTRPLTTPAGASQEMTLVLNGAFLVERARANEFRAAVATIVRDQEPLGLAFDFTGPWPPYNFADTGTSASHGG